MTLHRPSNVDDPAILAALAATTAFSFAEAEVHIAINAAKVFLLGVWLLRELFEDAVCYRLGIFDFHTSSAFVTFLSTDKVLL